MAWPALAFYMLVAWLIGLPSLCATLYLAGFAVLHRLAAPPALALQTLLASLRAAAELLDCCLLTPLGTGMLASGKAALVESTAYLALATQ